MYIFVTALVVSSKRSCNLLVFLGIEYCYLLMRTWRPTVELNLHQKTDKHAHSLFFNRITVKKTHSVRYELINLYISQIHLYIYRNHR